MRLPIPFKWDGQEITEFEVTPPKAGVVAETKQRVESAGYFAAMMTLTTGVIESLGHLSLEDVKKAVRQLPYRDVELIALQGVLTLSEDDKFEGVYQCPRCGHKEITEAGEVDTRDSVADVAIGYVDSAELEEFILDQPVEFTSKGEVIDTIESVKMHHPTIEECVKAERKVGSKDSSRLQFAIYANAIETVNDQPINDQWRNTFGVQLFEKMDSKTDMRGIGSAVSEPGMQNTIEKHCRECGKVWQAPVSTTNFFVSALQ